MITFCHPKHHLSKIQSSIHLSVLHISTTTTNLNTNPLLQTPQNPAPPPPSPPIHSTSISTLLTDCTNLQHLLQIHAHITRTHFLHTNPFSVHYNNIIRSYTRLDNPTKALCVYISMSRDGVFPDRYTIPIVLKVTTRKFGFCTGLQLHCVATKHGLVRNEYCESGFISFYAKGGDFGSAYKVFDENPGRCLGSWNAIIAGLMNGKRVKEGLEMFLEMRKCGAVPDDVTMASVLSGCGSIGDLVLARQLHKYVFQAKRSERFEVLMMNSVIDMYGKCGRMDLANMVFLKMDGRNVSSWTSMIVNYAMHGHVGDALECFRRMTESGVSPNNVTFLGVLSACVHGGLVEEGKHHFDMMQKGYGVRPDLKHYGCMVDLLGRAGLFEEAKEMVEGLPMKPNSVILGCLLGACEKYGHVKMGEWVAKHLQELEPWNDGVYVVLSNIYARRGLWEDVERIRILMKQRRLAKIPAYSLSTS